MSMIICDECGQQISDKAAICINCGYPINNENQHNDQNSQQGAIENSSTNKVDIALLIKLVCFIGVVLLVIFFIPKLRAQQEENWRTSKNRVDFILRTVNLKNLECEEVLEKVKETNFKNAVHSEIRLLSYEEIYEISKTDEIIECMAKALFTTGSEGRFIFYISNSGGKQNIGFRRP